MSCPSCSSMVPEGARFCPSCGHLLVLSEERRIVTVLFADLVGFTALSADADPEFVKHLIDRCFERLVSDVTSFGGTVDKIVGDAIVALFGAPRAHEDDPERAVRAALRMQRSLADATADVAVNVEMRVGINTGEVLVGAISAGGDYTAMGDTVNLASRLESMADPGEVLVGPATRDATVGAIEYASRGSVDVRGRDQAIEVFSAVGELRPPGRRRKSVNAPLVGREPEQAHLCSAIDASIARNRAHLFLVLGEAGMGKTRLAEEAAAASETNHDALVLEGRVLPYGETNPYRPIGEALSTAFEIEDGDSHEAAEAKIWSVVTRLLSASGDAGDNPAEIDDGVERASRAALHILGYATPIEDLEPARAREEIQLGLSALFGAAAARRPTIITLGDIHWADHRLLDLVEFMLGALANTPFIVIASARWAVSEERWVVPPGRHNTTVINLDPLDRGASAELVASMLGVEASEQLTDALYDRSGGNPFFLEELTTLLKASGPGDNVRSDLAQRLGDLPDTLRGLVSARLDALDPDERRMVDDASVIGKSGHVYSLLIMAQADDRTGAEQTFRRLVDKDVFITEGDRWTFRSDVVRDIAYSTLTKSSRARTHLAIADWLARQPDEGGREVGRTSSLARHYTASAKLVNELGPIQGVPTDVVDSALRWTLEAGARASARDAYLVAGKLFAEGLEIVDPSDPRRAELAIGRANARLGLRELDGAEEDAVVAKEIAERLGDTQLGAAATMLLGEIATARGDIETALERLDDAIGQWRAMSDDAEVAEALRLRGMALLQAGDRDSAERDFTEALDVFMDLGDTTGEAWCQQNLAWVSFELGHVDQARRRLDRAIELFDRNDDAGGLGWARGLSAYLHFHSGDSDQAETIARQVLAEAVRRGDRFGEPMMRLLTATIELWRGQCRLAAEDAGAALAVMRDTESEFGVVQALATLSRAYAALGQLSDSRQAVEEAIALAAAAPGQPQLQFAYMVAGAAAAQAGDTERSLSYLELVRDEPDGPLMLGSTDRLVTRALAMLQAGRIEEAAIALDMAPRDGGSGQYLASTQALLEVTRGELDEAVARANVVADDNSATYLDRRSALIAAGLAHARAGDAPAAIEAFDRATAMIDATDSRLSQAVVRLATAIAYEHLGLDEAPQARQRAIIATDGVGAPLSGWEHLFVSAVSGSSMTLEAC